MSDLNQLILNFDYDQNFKDQDFYVSKSNEFAFKLLNSWPKVGKEFCQFNWRKFFWQNSFGSISFYKSLKELR
jgi:chromosomal replication initiation ATPase DnaA